MNRGFKIRYEDHFILMLISSKKSFILEVLLNLSLCIIYGVGSSSCKVSHDWLAILLDNSRKNNRNNASSHPKQ